MTVEDCGNEPVTGLPECESIVGHKWRVVNVDVQGHGSLGNYLYETCEMCGIVRVRRAPEVFVQKPNGDYEKKKLEDIEL